MKKVIYLCLILLISLNIASCGSTKDKVETELTENQEQEISKDETTNNIRAEGKEFKVNAMTTNDSYNKAKWVYGPANNEE